MEYVTRIIEWITANPELALLIIGAVADTLAGALPDKWARWPGLLLTIANRMYQYGKEEKPGEVGE